MIKHNQRFDAFFSRIKQKTLDELLVISKDKNLDIKKKEDKTFVTIVDLAISHLVKKEIANFDSSMFFHSEEDQLSELQFPCAILDPIDGTKEFVQGPAECVLSLAIVYSPRFDDPRNQAFIFNPLTGFEMRSSSSFIFHYELNHKIEKKEKMKKNPSIMVSRSEWKKGLFNGERKREDLQVMPRGSIAFKLALLAAGGCDKIISKKPKNIWDICAGTILCYQRGIYFYQNGKKNAIIDNKIYNNDLVWE